MLMFNIFDNFEHKLFRQAPSFKGHFGVMLVRFLICGGMAIGLAYLPRRHFEEPFLRLKDRAPSTSTDAIREAAAA
jgi:peptidoglycan/LPS O-acetylase OafA/YrhL